MTSYGNVKVINMLQKGTDIWKPVKSEVSTCHLRENEELSLHYIVLQTKKIMACLHRNQ
jgi:hypothetical protein